MGFGKVLKDEILELGILVMVIVVISIILLKMRMSNTVACVNGATLNTNDTSSAICCFNSACTSNTTVQAVYNDVSTYVTAFSEPKNWVIIIIIGLVAVGLIALFMRLNKNK